MVDVLHTVDQGVASHIVGNTCWLFAVVRRAFGGRNQDTMIKNLYEDMMRWYKGQKNISSRLQGKLTVDRVKTSSGWPKLKAKAAATRHLAAYALNLAERFGTADDRRVVAACQLLCQFYHIISSESMFLNDDGKNKLPHVGRRLAVIYSASAEQAAIFARQDVEYVPEIALVRSHVRVARRGGWEPEVLLDL